MTEVVIYKEIKMNFIKFAGKMLLALVLFFPAFVLVGFFSWNLWRYIVAFLSFIVGVPVHKISG